MINVIILAAGVGSRLRPITLSAPKCMVPVNGIPLIERLVKQLELHKDKLAIHIVLGYKASVVVDAFKGHDINFIINDDYETTNNMYSFYLAAKAIENLDDVMIINADCIYDDGIVDKCVSALQSSILIDENFFNDESMKVEVVDGKIIGIAKTYQQAPGIYTSIDMYRLIGIDALAMVNHVSGVIQSGEKNSWTEVAINSIVKKNEVNVTPLSIGALRWYEIDNHSDLDIATKLFYNAR